MTTFDRTTMCKGCPFRKNSLPGWLGDYTPDEVVAAVWSEQHFMCHTEIDYTNPDWQQELAGKPHCGGAIQMAKVMCKLPRNPQHAAAVRSCKVEKNHLRKDFTEHHKSIPVKSTL